MDFSDQIHKKAIGICFIIFSLLGILCLLFYSYFIDFIVSFVAIDEDFSPDMLWIFEFIEKFIWAIAILFLVPRIILGIGLINRRKWAELPFDDICRNWNDQFPFRDWVRYLCTFGFYG